MNRGEVTNILGCNRKKLTAMSHQTNGRRHTVINARARQLCDLQFTICKFVTKAHNRGNLMY
jgi:hypothetical protein